MAASTVRQIHWILSGAFDRAVRWHWISVTPVASADPPPPPRPNPDPPSPEEAARILEEAWKDPDWGTFLWTAMTTGARRGEMCALRRSHVDRAKGVLRVPRSLSGSRLTMREKDTKTHQQRRVALDSETRALLEALIERQDQVAARLGFEIESDAYLFSLDPDCGRPLVPDTVKSAWFTLPVLQVLPDGTYLSRLRAPRKKDGPPIGVRVIEYSVTTVADDGQEVSELFALATTLLDPARVPAPELAAVYHQRWQAETGIGDLKSEQRGGPDTVLRSKTPDMVAQELWAMLCVYQSIRDLIGYAAASGLDPGRVSFKRAVEAARDCVSRAALSPPGP